MTRRRHLSPWPAKPAETRGIPLLGLLLAASVFFGIRPSEVSATEPARALVEASELASGLFARRLELRLGLDRKVPFRVFTLDDPARLVLDLDGLDWTGFYAARLARPRGVADLRVGRVQPGWARMVLDLDRPLALASAEMRDATHGAVLEVRLKRVAPEIFATLSQPPPGAWPSRGHVGGPHAAPRGEGPVTVVLDPGHGGVDPGALRPGVSEKNIVLAFARDLSARLAATGRYRVVTTRDADIAVSLADRVSLARVAGADAFLSIHTNAVADPSVSGAIAFTLSERGSSRAAAARARLENSADRTAGLAPLPLRDAARTALDDIARTEYRSRSIRLARTLVDALGRTVGVATSFPLQAADFQVLRAPDMASVLLELGFLSNTRDRAEMSSNAWRGRAAAAVVTALDTWVAQTGLAGAVTPN